MGLSARVCWWFKVFVCFSARWEARSETDKILHETVNNANDVVRIAVPSTPAAAASLFVNATSPN
jgi:hypothetical protein